MAIPFPRYRSFSGMSVCSLVCCAAFGAVAVSSTAPDAQAQSAPLPASQTSQPVLAWQTAAGGKMEFEVASIHPAGPGASTRQNFDMSVEDMTIPPGGRISATGALGMFIQFAYKLSVFQDEAAFEHLPKWATTEYFAIEAKAPTTNATKDQMRLMMQSLLADRFKLVVHFDTPDGPAMAGKARAEAPATFSGPGMRRENSASRPQFAEYPRRLDACLRHHPDGRLEKSDGDPRFAQHNHGHFLGLDSFDRNTRSPCRQPDWSNRKIRHRTQLLTTKCEIARVGSDGWGQYLGSESMVDDPDLCRIFALLGRRLSKGSMDGDIART
jgi:hypothetical protein